MNLIMNDATPRAHAIIIAAHAAGITHDELMIKIQDNIDMPVHADDVDKTIRANFSGDDDFDEMKHEVEHMLDMCHDTDEDCAWNEEWDED